MTQGSKDELSKLQLLDSLADADAQSLAARVDSVQARAGLLVGSAAIAATLASSVGHDIYMFCALVALASAALCGIGMFLPTRQIAIDTRRVAQNITTATSVQALKHVVDAKIEVSRRNGVSLRRTARFALAGLFALGAAVLLILISVGVRVI